VLPVTRRATSAASAASTRMPLIALIATRMSSLQNSACA
jgi:hypothetical protein